MINTDIEKEVREVLSDEFDQKAKKYKQKNNEPN